jgi:hypothetical protein
MKEMFTSRWWFRIALTSLRVVYWLDLLHF